jgi:hypothetical protein
MMDYFRDGGASMWGILIIFFFTAGLAAARPKAMRSSILGKGSVAVLAAGVLGLATGMKAVSAHVGSFPDKAEAIGIGLGELANNGTFSFILFTILGVASLATAPRPDKS